MNHLSARYRIINREGFIDKLIKTTRYENRYKYECNVSGVLHPANGFRFSKLPDEYATQQEAS